MIACNSCGAMVPEGAKFCPDCGAAMSGAQEEIGTVETISGLETAPFDDLPTEGHSANYTSETLDPGTMIADKYRIERVIGQGGMGRVYLATELIANGERERPVALKLISKKYAGSDKAIQRLIDEGLVTQELAHKNIVKVYGIGIHGAQPYIAMEHIVGTPLHVWRGEKMARNEVVPVRVAGQIITEVLNGLEAAHEAGVIHRDLKPENIMLLDEPSETDARVKIVDFGVALATKSADSGTGTGLGTQLYMAPEQVRNANAANAAADLYSISRIFYEMIVGVLPSGHWQPPSGGRSDVPRDIDALIEKGLSVNRDMRPQSAAEYRSAILTAFNSGTKNGPSFSNFGGDKTELDEARLKLKDAYIAMFKAMPIWVWIVIGTVIGLMLLADFMPADDGVSCYTDSFGNYLCQ